MRESSFEAPVEQSSEKKMNGIPYEVDPEDGMFIFHDIGIGGEVPSGDDFRDFIVNTERVGVRMDSTLVLPKETAFEDGGPKEIIFALPRSKQRGKIFYDQGVLYAEPINT